MRHLVDEGLRDGQAGLTAPTCEGESFGRMVTVKVTVTRGTHGEEPTDHGRLRPSSEGGAVGRVARHAGSRRREAP